MRVMTMSLLATLIVVGSAMAQPGGGGRGGEGGRGGRGGFDPAAMIERMFERDTNDDGKLSADELGDRGQRMLDRFDTDGDGSVTKEEVTKAMEDGGGRGERGERGERGGRGGPAGPGGGRMLSMLPLFKALDKDENGELSSEEIENATAALQMLDKDDDGKLVAEEMMPDMSQFERGGRGGPGGAGGRGGRGGGGGRGGRGGRGGGEGGERPERPAFD